MLSIEQKIQEWYALRKQLDDNKERMALVVVRELELRRQLMSIVWPKIKEGANYYQLPMGYTLKGTYKLDRKVDQAALPPVIIQLQKLLVNTDELVVFSPDLTLKRYRELTKEQQQIMDQALDVKPAAPTLEIVPPKAK